MIVKGQDLAVAQICLVVAIEKWGDQVEVNMKLRYMMILAVVLSLSAQAQDKKKPVLEPNIDMTAVSHVGTTTHEPINEMSGLVKSRIYPDVYWVHNDSGDIPRLFSIEKNGAVIFANYLKNAFHGAVPEEGKAPWSGIEVLLAANQDWEDIAIDNDKIYIADLGNNDNSRRDLGIYILYEPNPRAVHETRVLDYIPVRYPEQEKFPARQWHFDSEGMFLANGKLYFLTKHRQSGQPAAWEAGVNLYRLDTYKTSEANVLTKVDSYDQIWFATGADVSPDGKHLAIVTYTALWVFEAPRDDSKWLSGNARNLPLDYNITGQLEAVCWDNNETILISNEQRKIFEIKLADIPDAGKK